MGCISFLIQNTVGLDSGRWRTSRQGGSVGAGQKLNASYQFAANIGVSKRDESGQAAAFEQRQKEGQLPRQGRKRLALVENSPVETILSYEADRNYCDMTVQEKGFSNTGGSVGNDILDGGVGNDTVQGGAGADVYVFDHGYDQDTVSDSGGYVDGIWSDGLSTIRLAEDVTVEQIKVTRDLQNQYLSLINDADRLTLQSWMWGSSALDADICFADGTQWDKVALLNRIVLPATTIGAASIYGREDGEIVDRGEGNDLIYGLGGEDSLAGGDGNEMAGTLRILCLNSCGLDHSSANDAAIEIRRVG